MTRTMYDSVTAADIPRTARMVAGYVDGIYAWTAQDWAYHGAAVKVRITIGSGTLDADVADVETGDFTPATGAAWLRRKVNRDGFGVLYFSRSLFATVAAAVHAQGIKDNQWAAWIADWTGVAHNLPNTLATQYDHPPHSGGHYDLSLVGDYWQGVDPLPAPAPTPAPPAPTPPPPAPAPPPPAPGPIPPPPPPSPVQGVNDTRAAWARLADLLVTGFSNAIRDIGQVIQHLRDL